MLFLYADSRERLVQMLKDEQIHADAHEVTLAVPLDSIMLSGEREHFGFHDGIAQPRIAGLKADTSQAPKGFAAPKPARTNVPVTAAAIPAGEVILGYPNAYGIIPMTPTVPDRGVAQSLLALAPPDPAEPSHTSRRDLGRNGSYVVFRQLQQDVKAFWQFLDRQAGSDGARRKLLAAKTVGRWPNGAPLVHFDAAEPDRFEMTKANAFWYKDDLAGDRCPIGSHIRRSNPRDGLLPNRADSLLVADRHRLLRRGRAYGPPLAESFDPDDILATDGSGDRGLHFICFNTDLARQFEFVQNTWINSMKFDGLYWEPDPVVAPHLAQHEARHPEEVSRFTFMSAECPVRHRLSDLPRVVTMVGGAYLFMPGLAALRFLSRADVS
jgi:Dyp-type peroxidase family